MGQDITIIFKNANEYISSMNQMAKSTRDFSSALVGVKEKINDLNKNKIKLQVDTEQADKKIKELSKSLDNIEKKSGSSTSATGGVTSSSTVAVGGVTTKSSTSSGKKSLQTNVIEGAGGDLLSAGVQAFASDLAGIANIYAKSALGAEKSNIGSNILNSAASSAATGAAIGTAIAPGVGTAVGAVVGGVVGGTVGYFKGKAENFEKQDEYFKDYYKNQYTSIKEEQKATLTAGSSTAAAREQNKVFFSAALGGDSKAEAYLKQMSDFGLKSGFFQYNDLVNISKSMLGAGIKQEDILPSLSKLGDPAAALGWSAESTAQVAASIEGMKSQGQVTMESLGPILESLAPIMGSGVDVLEAIAKSSKDTTEGIKAKIADGKLSGAEAVKGIYEYLEKGPYAGSMKKYADTFSGSTSAVEEAKSNVNSAKGDGFNKVRSEGNKKESEYLNGEGGQRMKKAYNMMGQWEASLINLSEQYERDATDAIMVGSTGNKFSDKAKNRLAVLREEYVKYENSNTDDAKLKMGEIISEAMGLAQNEYNASGQVQSALKSNLKVAENLKNDAAINTAYWDAGYQMAMQFSLGMKSATAEEVGKTSANTLNKGQIGDIINNNKGKSNIDLLNMKVKGPYGPIESEAGLWYPGKAEAVGLSYVPYDNFPALLHEGERVLTAGENRGYQQNAAPVITGNTFVIREEADIQKVARELARNMKMTYALN